LYHNPKKKQLLFCREIENCERAQNHSVDVCIGVTENAVLWRNIRRTCQRREEAPPAAAGGGKVHRLSRHFLEFGRGEERSGDS